jgi:epoxide hydrolase-like predicted phosphatase
MSLIAHSHEMIKVVVFDFGNVVCRFDNAIIVKRISAATGKSVRELEEIVGRASDLIVAYERGMVSSDEFYARIVTISRLHLPKDKFVQAYTDKFTPIPETFELIRTLKKRFRLGLLSNTSEWDFEYGVKTTEVFPLFDAVTVSFQVHSLKPEKKIYLDVLAKLGVQPHECVYIDDIAAYADAARDLGWHAVHYRSPQQLVESLRELQVM